MVLESGQSHICYPGRAGTLMDHLQSAEWGRQTSAIVKRDHKENGKEISLPPKG